MENIKILFIMFFLHIVDDFYLQGILAQMKQKDFWVNHKQYKPLYKYDYIMALIAHSFSWAFMIELPFLFMEDFNVSYIVMLFINLIVHAIVDNVKANKLKINLITDQSIHIIQIVVTWFVLFA